MKLIKIGSAPSCDIVLHSNYVSALHAELTILDSGEIIIEDKNSSNGTFVGTKRITPNSEVSIHRGDYVRIADVDLPWVRIPAAQKASNYRQIVNIGSNFRNDIVVSNGTVSRYHATLKIDKKGRVFICDNSSRNGTQVNGIKITPDKDIRIKKGDIVICGGEDVTDQIAFYIPSSSWKMLAAVVAAACFVGLAGYGVWTWWVNRISPEEYQSAVVYVHTAYHYEVSVHTTYGDITFRYPENEDDFHYSSGTAFFLDREGRMGTARHVAVPWDEAYTKDTREELEKSIQQFMHNQLRTNHVSSQYDLQVLMSTKLGKNLANSCEDIAELNTAINSILNGRISIQGVTDFLAVAYSGRTYSSIQEMSRCKVLAESGNAEKDVALLQLNDNTTPANIKQVFDVQKIKSTVLKPQKDKLYTIGFPHGLTWGIQDKTLTSNMRNTYCSKESGKFNFEFQNTSQPGASGSPVYMEDGRLVGIISKVYSNDNGPTMAAHAAFLRELYEENTRPIATNK